MGIFKMLGSPTGSGNVPAIAQFIDNISSPLNALMIGVLVIIALAAVVFAIYVGFRLAKAEDDGKRKEAKQQLLWSIIAVVVCVAMAVLITAVLDEFSFDKASRIREGGNSDIDDAVGILVGSIVTAFTAVLKLASVGAMLFAIYIGIRLAMAEDEGKRKQAKMQLLWTLVAVVGVILLVVVIDMIVYGVLIDMLG